MSNIAHLKAQPDEIFAGLLGRAAASNSCNSAVKTLTGLRVALDLPPRTYPLQVMAAYLGYTSLQVAQRHTLLPVNRAFSAHLGTKREQEILNSETLNLMHADRSRHEAMACPTCVAEDQRAGQLGRWRRLHHLPHVDWCPVHRTPLLKFQSADFAISPFQAISSMSTERRTKFDGVAAGSALDRYAQLMSRWLTRDSAISCATLNRVAQDGCRMHGLRTSQAGKRELASDRARQVLPAEWLAKHWPKLVQKSSCEYVARFDGVTKDRHVAYTGATCALVLAVLFDSVDDIEVRLQTAQQDIASSTDYLQTSVRSAIGAFKEGASLQQASRAHGVAVGHLERWLRDMVRIPVMLTNKPGHMTNQSGLDHANELPVLVKPV